jgi:hypothetical protein
VDSLSKSSLESNNLCSRTFTPSENLGGDIFGVVVGDKVHFPETFVDQLLSLMRAFV